MIRAASTLRSYQRHAVRSQLSAAATSLNTSSVEEEQSTKCHALPRINVVGMHGLQGNNMSMIQKRFQSTDANQGGSVENTLDKLFDQQEATGEGDEWFLDQAADAWEPTWYNLADHAVNAVHGMHDFTGLHYAGSIVAVTCALRFAILPVAVRAQRAASRMGHLQPELALIKKRYEALGTPTQAEQKAFAESMRSLFKKYEVSPFAAMAGPLIQAPLFIGMFFGMKKMPELFGTEMSTGGVAWFTDLTVPDPTYILPVACGMSFLATIESGKEQMIDGNPEYGPILVNAFRGMCFVMVPVMTTFPAVMLCYWVPNNFITLVQSVTLRNVWVKKQLGIWDRPKPIPGTTPDVGIKNTVEKLVKQVKGEPTTEAEKIKRHNEDIETKRQVEKMSKTTRARRRKVSTSASTRRR
jgi:YidC/Oxa1 family membrane protein insertase